MRHLGKRHRESVGVQRAALLAQLAVHVLDQGGHVWQVRARQRQQLGHVAGRRRHEHVLVQTLHDFGGQRYELQVSGHVLKDNLYVAVMFRFCKQKKKY